MRILDVSLSFLARRFISCLRRVPFHSLRPHLRLQGPRRRSDSLTPRPVPPPSPSPLGFEAVLVCFPFCFYPSPYTLSPPAPPPPPTPPSAHPKYPLPLSPSTSVLLHMTFFPHTVPLFVVSFFFFWVLYCMGISLPFLFTLFR